MLPPLRAGSPTEGGGAVAAPKKLPIVADAHKRLDIFGELKGEQTLQALPVESPHEVAPSPGPAAAPQQAASHDLIVAAPRKKKKKKTWDKHPCWRNILIRPDSPGKIMWDLLAILLLVYTIIFAPMRIGFEVEDFCPSPIWLWDMLVDVSFVTDLLLNFVTAIYNESAKGHVLQYNPKVIALAYVKSWFVIDVLSSAPIDLIMSLAVNGCSGGPAIDLRNLTHADADGHEAPDDRTGNILRMLRMVRMLKLAKILRVLKLQNRVNDLGDRFPSLLNLTVFKLVKLLFLTLYVAHLLACGFYLVGSNVFFYGGARGRRQSWLATAQLDEGLDERTETGLDWAQVGEPYTAAMYWTFTTITTVGFGDIVPAHPAERWYAIMCMIIGTLIFGQTVAGLSEILESAGGGHKAMQARLNALHAFMREKKLSYELQVRIRRHFRFYWQRAVTLDDAHDELLRQLSAPLRHEVVKAMYRAVIAALPVFHIHEDENFWDAMLRAMQPHLIAPDEKLMEQGRLGNEMYLVTHGRLEVFYRPSHYREEMDSKHVRFIKSGDFVGEIALFSAFELGSSGQAEQQRRDLRTATVVARDHCELFAVERQNFLLLCKDFPVVRDHFMQIAKERVKHTAKLENRVAGVAAKFARRLVLKRADSVADIEDAEGGAEGAAAAAAKRKKQQQAAGGPSGLFSTLNLLTDALRDEANEVEEGADAEAAEEDSEGNPRPPSPASAGARQLGNAAVSSGVAACGGGAAAGRGVAEAAMAMSPARGTLSAAPMPLDERSCARVRTDGSVKSEISALRLELAALHRDVHALAQQQAGGSSRRGGPGGASTSAMRSAMRATTALRSAGLGGGASKAPGSKVAGIFGAAGGGGGGIRSRPQVAPAPEGAPPLPADAAAADGGMPPPPSQEG